MKAFRARAQTYLALVLLGGLAACGGSSPSPDGAGTAPAKTPVTTQGLVPEAASGEPVDGDAVVFRLAVEPGHLNYLLDTADAYCFQICRNIFDSLLDRDQETLDTIPMLAESWEVSEDHLTYTYKLRTNAVFSDGVPLTAHDVKWTFDTILDPKNQTADKRNYFQDIDRIEVLDDHLIRFHMRKPYFKHLTEIGDTFIFPRHIYGEGDINDHPYARKPVGSGPYRFDSWQTNQEIVLTRNPSYWNKDKAPHLDRYVYKVITNDEAAFIELEKQNIDLMGLMPEQWVNQASRPQFDEKFNKLTYWTSSGYIGGFSYIGWNLRKPQFEDKRVRRALTMLLDRQSIMDEIFYGLGRLVSGSEPWQTTAYDARIEPWPFDPAEAKRLLDEAGWRDTNQDGVRDKDGADLRFEFLMPSGSREVEQMLTVYQEELKRAGIAMTIRPIEWATFLEFVTERKFDAVTLSWAIPVDSDPYQIWHSTQTEQGSNYPGFKNPEVDAILEAARLAFDREERHGLYRRLHAILHEEQPYTFLWSRQTLVAVDKRFRGVRVYPQGLYQLEWWVPAALQRYP